MAESNLRTAFIQLHLSVLLAGFTGLFGKLITLNEATLTWYRLFFTTAILLLFTGFPKVSWKKFLQIAGCGTLLGLHWILFYASIKASNVSIGVVCFASVGFFTSIFEPLVFHKRFSVAEMLLALITVAGLVCIFSFDSRYRLGIILGIISAAVCSLYSITNKKAGDGVKARTMLLYQMAGGLLGVSVLIPLYLLVYPPTQPVMVIPTGSDLWWLLCLALFCTAGLYLLQILVLRKLSAFTVNLTYNLEPCYTILIAFIAFGEARELNASFYVGISLVILSVLLQTARALRRN
ncbi:MAG TPA: EamA family transporter [Rikenellaceae bacterium]|nr:EamA family transporter [Rikenellaceae bacterium]